MNLIQKEREHFEWQEKTFYEMTGRFINRVSIIEGLMMDSISIHFSREKERLKDLFKYVLADTSLKTISEIFLKLVEEKYIDYYLQNKEVIKKIDSYIRRRNLLCHSHLDANEGFIKKFDKTRIQIKNVRRFKETHEFVKWINIEEQNQMIQDAFKLSLIINEFRKNLKRGKIKYSS